MNKFAHHTKHYLPLIGVLSAGVIGFIVFPYDKNFQLVLATAMCLGYVSWGIVHHYMHKDLYLEVVLEYVMLAVLGLALMFSVIFRG